MRAGRSYENGGSANVGVDAAAVGVVFSAAAVAVVGGAVRGAGSETPTTGGSVRARLVGDAILPRWPIMDRSLFQAVQELDLERGRPTSNTVIDFYNPTEFTFNFTSSQPSPLRPLQPTSQTSAWRTVHQMVSVFDDASPNVAFIASLPPCLLATLAFTSQPSSRFPSWAFSWPPSRLPG